MAEKIGRALRVPVVESETLEDSVSSPVFSRKYPSLFKFLQKSDLGGNPYTTGTLQIFYENSMFKICVNNRAIKKSAFVSGVELAQALIAAERGVRTNTLNWRPYGPNRKVGMQTPLNLS